MERSIRAFAAAFALVAMLALPSATAASGEEGRGFFDARLPFTARGEIHLEAAGASALALGAPDALLLEGAAARLVVERTSAEQVVVSDPRDGAGFAEYSFDPERTSSEFADVTLALSRAGGEATFFATPTPAGHALVVEALDGGVEAVAGESFQVGEPYDAEAPTTGDAPYNYRLDSIVEGPTFAATLVGSSLRLTGSFQLFLFDVDLHVLDAEGRESTIETGMRPTSPGQRTIANAVLTFEGADVTLAGAETVSVFAPKMTLGVSGAAVLRDAVGGFHAGDDSYEAAGKDIAVKGALAYDLSLVDGATDRALVEVAGSLESITLAPTENLDAARYLVPAAKAAAVGGGALLLVASAVLVVRHRHPLVARRAIEGDPAEAAVLALDAGEDGEAARLFEAALETRPDDVVLLVDYGTTLERLGRTMRARDVYERAVRLDPGRGETHYYYSRVLAALGLTASALPHLQRALTLDPRLREMARRDPGFRPLADHPTFAALVA